MLDHLFRSFNWRLRKFVSQSYTYIITYILYNCQGKNHFFSLKSKKFFSFSINFVKYKLILISAFAACIFNHLKTPSGIVKFTRLRFRPVCCFIFITVYIILHSVLNVKGKMHKNEKVGVHQRFFLTATEKSCCITLKISTVLFFGGLAVVYCRFLRERTYNPSTHTMPLPNRIMVVGSGIGFVSD